MHIPKPVVAVALLVFAALAVAFRPQDKPTLDYGAGAGWAGPHPSQLVHLHREFLQNGQQELISWFQRVPGNGLVIKRVMIEGIELPHFEILQDGVLVARKLPESLELPIPIRGGTRLDLRFKVSNWLGNPGRIDVFGYVW
ncbi:MAG: hypothetical protein IT458_10820 [Planctomycetes bacterium]|nr:hypothetical protein [Planctomycetota bacterium]